MNRYIAFLLALAAILAGCKDDRFPDPSPDGFDEGELVEAKIRLSVNSLSVSVDSRTPEPSPDPEPETEAEKHVGNIWVFQYDATTGKQLIKPRYYTVTDQTEALPVYLKANVSSVVRVVANTQDNTWAADYTRFSTSAMLDEAVIPDPEPLIIGDGYGEFAPGDDLFIPMQGASATVTVNLDTEVTVPVTRMFAKVRVSLNIKAALGANFTFKYMEMEKIPWLCRVKTLFGSTTEGGSADEQEKAIVPYPADTEWVTRSVDKDTDFVIYIPENLQGENDNETYTAATKWKGASDRPNALKINFGIEYVDDEGFMEDRIYTVYPGGNNHNNFNVKRNCVYRVEVYINTITPPEGHTPSANCFVVVPGKNISFEPYYRTEVGGGYDFKDYLDADDATGEKVINKVKILWQTENAIGDNSAGDLVWYDSATKKIYVKTKQEGNAVIAAYNSSDEIIWSWHIWVTPTDPGNIGKAIRYTTYDWNASGIKTDRRVPGYAVMLCNLGATAIEPTADDPDGIKTWGTQYQWGRKDPFPSYTIVGSVATKDKAYFACDYTKENTYYLYDNSHVQSIEMTSSADETKLFHSKPGNEITPASMPDPVKYTIQHPTVFMCGTKEARYDKDVGYCNNGSNYLYRGDWTWKHDNKLWGGLEPDPSSVMRYGIQGTEINLWDNYGVKSIFDPCPKGWRVPAGEIWIGFTSTGKNPTLWGQVNYNEEKNTLPDPNIHGVYLYLNGWKEGDYSYFPTPGPRQANGWGVRLGICGNYHSATSDINDRVNILHIHVQDLLKVFQIFETMNYAYHVKSFGGPIRCVRDHK